METLASLLGWVIVLKTFIVACNCAMNKLAFTKTKKQMCIREEMVLTYSFKNIPEIKY